MTFSRTKKLQIVDKALSSKLVESDTACVMWLWNDVIFGCQ